MNLVVKGAAITGIKSITTMEIQLDTGIIIVDVAEEQMSNNVYAKYNAQVMRSIKIS